MSGSVLFGLVFYFW